MSVIRMYNAEVEPLAEFLLNLKLSGRKSRMRTRFVKILRERLQLVREEQIEIIKQHSNLEEDGSPVVKEVEGRSVYDIKDIEGYNKEYKELIEEEFVIEVNESNKDMIKSVEDSVLDCDNEYSGQDAMVYDRFCDILEGVEQ